MALVTPAEITENDVILNLRVFNRNALSLNKFNLAHGESGIDYITNIDNIISKYEAYSNDSELQSQSGVRKSINTNDSQSPYNSEELKGFSDKDFEQGRKNKENCKGK